MITISKLLQQAIQALSPSVDQPRLDAECLLSYVLNVPRTTLIAWPEKNVPEDKVEDFNALVLRRKQSEPIAYLVGKKEFWSMEFNVTHDTLVPRPETELLVETLLNRLDSQEMCRVADLGTGSGAIACAIAKERPLWQIDAIEDSPKAFAIAETNITQLGFENVALYQGHWCDGLVPGARYHAIVSNPPYIAENDPHLAQGDVVFEPRIALVSGEDGLNAIREIVSKAALHLKAPGYMMLEHGYDQAEAVRAILAAHGFEAIETLNDLSAHPRVTIGRRGF